MPINSNYRDGLDWQYINMQGEGYDDRTPEERAADSGGWQFQCGDCGKAKPTAGAETRDGTDVCRECCASEDAEKRKENQR